MPYGRDYLEQLRARLANATSALEERERELQALRIELASAEEKREREARRGSQSTLETAAGGVARLLDEYDELLEGYREALTELEEARAELDMAEGEEDALIELLPAAVPVALLPVRLETRFFPLDDSDGYELRIRVYPDVAHPDMHELELTDDELTWGKDWLAKDRQAENDAQRLQAWTMLCQRLGPRRAAWVAREVERRTTEGTLAQAPRRVAVWTRAARTSVLPDRFAAIGYSGSARVGPVWGKPIPDPLNVGPTPGAANADIVDAGMKWMVDFDEAEKVGMGIRMRIVPGELGLANARLDRLVVLGVKASLAEGDAAQRLAALLEAHHYSDGLAFVPKGTPSNNTAESPSGFSSRENLVRAFAVERGPAQTGGDGAALAAMLGIPAATFEHVIGGGDTEEADGRAINAALWPATWGYFLSQMMAELLAPADVAAARRHFIEFVRGRGWVLRIGDQPLGILPVTASSAWTPLPFPARSPESPAVTAPSGPEEEAALARLAVFMETQLRPIWAQSLAGVPRLGRTGDPEVDVTESLSATALSSQFAVRWAVGRELLLNVWSFFGWPPNLWGSFWNGPPGFSPPSGYDIWYGQAILLALLQARGLDWAPRITAVVFNTGHAELTGPLAGSGPLSEDEPLDPAGNYIDWLLKTDYRAIAAADSQTPIPTPHPLLFLMLRHAVLLAFADAAAGVESLTAGEGAPPEPLYEPELVDIDPEGSTLTPLRRLERFVPLGEEIRTIGSILQQLVSETTVEPPVGMAAALPQVSSFAPELQDFVRALRHLRDVPTAALERLLREHLDLCSHRLDAWITSLATRNLRALRAHGKAGLHLGGFGWLEDLAPRVAKPSQVGDPSGGGGTVAVRADNAGFVHAPSLGHAAAAAVLRSAHLSHAGPEGERFTIDLSSRRARTALHLLDGVRQGQSLKALLGYRFERGLHEGYPGLELDRYIAPFRRLAPLVAGKRETDPQEKESAVEATAAANVVDGLRLIDLWRNKQIPWGSDGLPPRSGSRHDAVVVQLEALADAADAVADALNAEAVYQVVQGNHLRAAAALDAAADGDAPPPDPQVLRSARSGVGVTNRMLMLFSDDGAPAAISDQDVRRAREDAEPRLNSWVAALFGSQPVRCRVEFDPYTDGQGTAQPAPASEEVLLSQLQLSPLDLLYLAEPSEEQRRSELEQRILYHVIRKRDDVTEAVPARIVASGSFVQQGELALAEFAELARAARELVAGAPRWASPRDVALPTEVEAVASQATIDVADLAARVGRAKKRLENSLEALEPPLPSDLEQLRKPLLDAGALGVAGAVPLVLEGADPDGVLTAQAASVRAELESREREIEQLEKDFAALSQPTPEETAAHHVERLQAALGVGFRVLPRFKLAAPAAAELAKAFAASSAQGARPEVLAQWIARSARLRPGVERLQTVLLYREALGRGGPALHVAQLPFDANDEWNGRASSPFPGGRIALMAHDPGGATWSNNLCGLFLDDWTEVVPNAAEMTAITFHFDAPNSEPPQAILLAVTPDGRETWDLGLLESIVNEALDLAKLRTVEPDALREVGHFLPALMFANNYSGDTVATDFSRNLTGSD